MSDLVAWLLLSLMNSFGANLPRYAELVAGPRNAHPRWGNLGLGRVIAPAHKTWRSFLMQSIIHPIWHFTTAGNDKAAFVGCQLTCDTLWNSVRTTPRGVNKMNTRESVSGAQRELLQVQYWQWVMLTAQCDHDFLCPRFLQEVQRHASAKTHKMEIWQIMMDYLQWYVNPVDAVFFLGKMEPDRMWPSGELKEIAIGVPWSDLAKLPWDEVGGKPLGKIGSTATESGFSIPKSKLDQDSIPNSWMADDGYTIVQLRLIETL